MYFFCLDHMRLLANKALNRFGISIIVFLLFNLVFSCESPQRKEDTPFAQEAQQFLNQYEKAYQPIYQRLQEELIRVAKGQTDSTNLKQATLAFEAFTGDKEHLRKSADFLKQINKLTPIQVKQLQQIMYAGAQVQQSMTTELQKKAALSDSLITHINFSPIRLRNRYYGLNAFDSLFKAERNEKVKLRLWEAYRKTTSGKTKHLFEMASINNQLVSAAGYGNFFEYKAGAYQLSTQELMQLQQDFLKSLRPLMAELHTYMRYELAKRYNVAVPQLIPPHWFADFASLKWGETLSNSYQQLDDSLATERATWIQEKAETYVRSRGYVALPAKYFDYQTNTRSKTQAFNYGEQIKIIVKPGRSLDAYTQLLGAFAKANYMLAYINPDVPLLLRKPINKSFEVAHQMEMQYQGKKALMHTYFPEDSSAYQLIKDDLLLQDALTVVPKLVYYLGVLQQFEFAVYANNLDASQANYKWWELYERFMGIATPITIDPNLCDPLMTHLHQQLAGSSADVALAIPLAFQLVETLQELPEGQTAYQFLQSFLYAGASYEFQRVYTEHFGTELNTQALLTHFNSVYRRLRVKNQGRRNTIPKWD